MLLLLRPLGSVDNQPFIEFIQLLVPALLPRLYVTVKAISQSANECLQGICFFALPLAILPIFFESMMKETHAIVRQRCTQYVDLFLIAAISSSSLRSELQSGHYLSSLTSALHAVLMDRDGSTRKSARLCFFSFERAFPSEASALASQFSSPVLTAVEQDQPKLQPRSGKPELSLLKASSSSLAPSPCADETPPTGWT